MQERISFMEKFKYHLISYQESYDVIEQKIDQINIILSYYLNIKF